MTMTLAERADEYRETRRLVSWKSDPASVEGGAGALDQSISEHSGRWLYELFQNAEDARAPSCTISLEGDQLVISDDGNGVPPEAIESLSNPFVSTKNSSGNIGRKGIGFCSVFKLCDNPIIWSGGTGVHFSRIKTHEFLSSKPELSGLLDSSDDLPYLHALLPFGITEWPKPLSHLEMKGKGTSVILPLKEAYDSSDIIEELSALDHRFILTFTHLKRITFQQNGNELWSLKKSLIDSISLPGAPNIYSLEKDDPEGANLTESYAVWRRSVTPPTEIIETSLPSRKDRERFKQCSVSIMHPVDADGSLSDIQCESLIYVYYPTEKVFPLSVLVHGDFLLDISRKHLIDPRDKGLNSYLLGILGNLILDVANSFSQKSRALEGIQLLKLSSRSDMDQLLDLIPDFTNKVKEKLTLPDRSGNFTPLENLSFLSTAITKGKEALALLQTIDPQKQIAIDELCSESAFEVIHNYSKSCFDESDIVKVLTKPFLFTNQAEKHGYCQAAWEWLVATCESRPDGRHTLSLEKLKIIPTSSGLVASGEQSSPPCIAHCNEDLEQLPKWLQIDKLDKEFASWISENQSKFSELLDELCIEPFSEAYVVQALDRALKEDTYLKNPKLHQKALDFIREREWPDHPQLEDFNWNTVKLGNLLIPVTQRGQLQWVRARTANLGKAWSGLDLESIYSQDAKLYWVTPSLKAHWPQSSSFLQICGALDHPRLAKRDLNGTQKHAFWRRIAKNAQEHQRNQADPESRCDEPLPVLKRFDQLELSNVDRAQATTLMQLLYRAWDSYYSQSAECTAKLHYWQYYDFVKTENVWMHDLLTNLRPPCRTGTLIEQAPLGQLWLKTSDTPEWPLTLFPAIDLEAIDDSRGYKEWLADTGMVRTRPSQIPENEWNDTILPALEEKFSEHSKGSPRKLERVATLTYRGLLDSYEDTLPRPLSIPRAVLQNGGISIAARGETAWAVFSEHERKEWQTDLPVFQFTQQEKKHACFKQLGYKILEDHLETTLADKIANSPNLEDATHKVQDELAWVYADRCKDTTKPPSPQKWKRLTAKVCPRIVVEKSIDGFSRECEVPYFYDSGSHRLLFTHESFQEPDTRASALVEALKLPENLSDRIEILLGKPDRQKRSRLIKDGMLADDLKEWLAKYRGEWQEQARPVAPREKTPEQNDPNKEEHAATETLAGEELQVNTSPKLHTTTVAPEFPAPVELETPTIEQPNDSPTAPFALNRRITSRTQARRPRQVPEDALDIEAASRDYVEKALNAMGYTVTQLNQMNPGYDLDARKEGEVLYVEVKGSKGSSTEVYITPTERKKYEDSGTAYKWQLWHVCCLSDEYERPQIRIYEELPEAAFHSPHYIINLAACSQIPHEMP